MTAAFDREHWRSAAEDVQKDMLATSPEEFARWGQTSSGTMPPLYYAPVAAQFQDLIQAAGLVSNAVDYVRWMKTNQPQLDETDWVASAGTLDLCLLCTALIRSERFSEGTIGQAFKHGMLHAILGRAIALSDHLPFAPAGSVPSV